MHGKDKKFAHEGERTMLAAVRKAAREGPIPSYYEITTHTARLTACWAGLTVADGKNGGSISYSP